MNKTIDYYNLHASDYFDNTIGADMSAQISRFRSHLPSPAKILDCGCGSGRDTKTFLDLGYDVFGIDGSEELCRLASEYTGREVVCRQFSDIEYIKEYDGIWACASLLHLPIQELTAILDKLRRALKPGGVLYASFKYGTGERWDADGKFYCDLNEARAGQLFGEDAELWLTTDYRGVVWLNVLKSYE